jgi:hypothetical protein
MAEARKSLTEDEGVVYYTLSPDEAYDDRLVRDAVETGDSRSFAAARLAEKAGFNMEASVCEWWSSSAQKKRDNIFVMWKVLPSGTLDKRIIAMVWDHPDGGIEYTLTRSTTHPGWQLTTWGTDGTPWGHRDIEGDIAEAFDTSPMASGVPLVGLARVVFSDGKTLVREGAAQNPRPRISLLQGAASVVLAGVGVAAVVFGRPKR